MLLAGLTPLLLRALLLPVFPIPAPRIHDEFCHLLLADTLVHGRLVNPVHPFWVHFESMHMTVRPVYASIYPVAQGSMMALSQVLTGHPWFGVWLSVGFMCAAICWMLQGWYSPRWALLGSLLVAARFGVFSYWMNSYYGGAIPAAAGALVLGAVPRILRWRRWRDAAVLGVGVALLANSRPYEGLVFLIPFAALLLWRLHARILNRAILVPLFLILGATATGMGFYFTRFTGNALVMPYQFFRATFTEAPHFIFQAPRPEPVYYHRVLRHYYSNWEMGAYREARANRSPHGVLDKAKNYTRFYLGLLAIPFAAALWRWRRPRIRFLFLSGALFSAALALEVWDAPHYAAPAIGLMLVLVLEGFRHLRRSRAGSWVAAAVCLGTVLFPVSPGGLQVGDGRQRQNLLRRLEAAPAQHLVLVRYKLNHDPGDEWVYNGADIDRSKVVWAREMDQGRNRRLVQYFASRHAWLVEPDTRPVRISAYDPSMLPDPPFRFVRLGAEGVPVLRSPQEVRRKLLANLPDPAGRLNCDQWNFYLNKATGVEPPDPAHGCFPPGHRDAPIAFDPWFAWLRKQN